MRRLAAVITAALVAQAGAVCAADIQASTTAPAVAPDCAGCHTPAPGTLFGVLDTLSTVVRALQLDLGTRKAVLSWDASTQLEHIASLDALGQHVGEGLRVSVEERGKRLHATAIARFDSATRDIAAADRLSKAAFKQALRDASVRVFDVRPAAQYHAGHLSGAESLPATAVAAAQAPLPVDREAPVVVYGAGGCAEAVVVSRLRGLGFADVKLYPAGFAHWAETEHSATTIGYAPQPKPGAMPLADFTALARAPSDALTLVDLRDEHEIWLPTVSHAVNIPFPELAERVASLPPERTPVFYCPTGARAAMAHTILANAGRESRFLEGGAVVDAEGRVRLVKR